MDKIEHMKRMQAEREHSFSREKAEMPHVGHHHFEGYSHGEAVAHMHDMGMKHSEHPHFGGGMERKEPSAGERMAEPRAEDRMQQ